MQAAVAGGGHCLQARPEPPRRMGGQGALDQGKGSGATHCGVNPWGDRLGLRRREASSFSLWKTPGLPAGPAPLSPPGRCAGRSPPPRTLGRLHESWGNAERTGANRGRRRTLPQPSAGLRPRGEAAGLLPSPPPAGGATEHLRVPGAAVCTGPGPRGHLESSSAEMPRAFQPARGPPGLAVPIHVAAEQLGTREVPEHPVRLPTSLDPGGPAAQGLKGIGHPHALGGKRPFPPVRMATSFRPARP